MNLLADLRVDLGDLHLDIGMSIASGEVVSVLGPNGAGKTTALRLLAGLLSVDSGRIELDGVVLDDPASGVFVPAEDRSVSVVFQDHLLFPHLSALENIAFGLRARGATKRAARLCANDWLARFGLADKAFVRPERLSGGEAQRVALARALAPEPRLLLMDEPLASLDVGTRASVRRDLRRYLDDFGGSAVLVTHDPLDAIALASSVIIVEEGGVTQVGPIDEIMTNPTSSYVADLIGLKELWTAMKATEDEATRNESSGQE